MSIFGHIRSLSNPRVAARELSAIGLRLTGLPTLVRWLATRNRVAIVMYHDPSPEVLDRHLAYLAKRFHFITLGQLVDALHDKNLEALPERSLVVTIDDGHRGNRRLGEVFRRWGCRPTIYVCTGVVGTRRRFWFHAGSFQHLKRVTHEERLRELAQKVGFSPTREYDGEPVALTHEELAEMREWADIESHTRFHPILTTCDDAECEREIDGSRRDVAEMTGRPCQHFSFPNGDFTERELDMVRRAGFRSSRTTDFGWNGADADPFRLRVCGASDDASTNILAVQLSCISSYIRCLLDGSFTGETRKNVIARPRAIV